MTPEELAALKRSMGGSVPSPMPITPPPVDEPSWTLPAPPSPEKLTPYDPGGMALPFPALTPYDKGGVGQPLPALPSMPSLPSLPALPTPYDKTGSSQPLVPRLPGEVLQVGGSNQPGKTGSDVPVPGYPTPTPAPVPTAPSGPTAPADPMNRDYVRQQFITLMQQYGITPGPRGSGAADVEYWADQALGQHGWEQYWADKWLGSLGTSPARNPTPSPSPAPSPAAPRAPTPAPTPTAATTNKIDPNLTGTAQQAVDYLQSEAQRVLGRSLTDAEIQQAADLVGYKDGMTVTGAMVNTILSSMDRLKTTPAPAPAPPSGPQPPGPPAPGPLGPMPYDPSTFDDPATQYYEDLLKAYTQRLLQPQDTSGQQFLWQTLMDQFTKMQGGIGPYENLAQQRITDLQGPVFSKPQEEAVRTGLFDQLEQQRAQAIQQAHEHMAALGHGSTSGTIQEADRQINQHFDQLRAQQENSLATYTIGEQQNRSNQAVSLGADLSNSIMGRGQQALGYAGNISDLSQTMNAQDLSRFAQAVAAGGQLADLPAQRLQLALQAFGVGNGPTQSLGSNAINLLQVLTQQQQADAQQRAQFAGGMGQYLATILSRAPQMFQPGQSNTVSVPYPGYGVLA